MHWAGGVCPGGDRPGGRGVPGPEADTPPRNQRQTLEMTIEAGSTHPTEIHPCFFLKRMAK